MRLGRHRRDPHLCPGFPRQDRRKASTTAPGRNGAHVPTFRSNATISDSYHQRKTCLRLSNASDQPEHRDGEFRELTGGITRRMIPWNISPILRYGAPMIFRQFFDSTSGTYTYLLASRQGGEALIIDPVLEKVDRYLQLIRELDLKLVKAVDTHLHADHITGLGALRDRTHCITVMGEKTNADVVSMRVAEGDRVEIEGVRLDVLYTPGPHRRFLFLPAGRPGLHRRHAVDPRHRPHRFPERRSARAIRFDFQQAAEAARRNAGLSRRTTTKATRSRPSAKRSCFNPRLKVKSIDEYAELMNNLNLPNPKMMDVAVPANMHVGLHQEEVARKGWALSAAEAIALHGRPDIAIVDLREKSEREKHGVIPGCAARALSRSAGRNRARAAYCTNWRPHPASASSSTALSASARRWRCKRRRTPGLKPPAILPAALTPGRRRTAL